MRNKHVEKLVKLALLCAMSLVLMYVVRFPIIPALFFLEYDMADVPILIGTFMYGPVAGLAITAVVSVLQAVTVSASSGWIGCIMHFFATGAFAVIAGVIYRRRHNIRGAIEGLLLGAAAMVIIMVPFNYYLSPIFISGSGMSYAEAQSYVWSYMWSFVAFNALKALINSAVTFVVYKPLSRLFKKEFLKKEPHPGK